MLSSCDGVMLFFDLSNFPSFFHALGEHSRPFCLLSPTFSASPVASLPGLPLHTESLGTSLVSHPMGVTAVDCTSPRPTSLGTAPPPPPHLPLSHPDSSSSALPARLEGCGHHAHPPSLRPRPQKAAESSVSAAAGNCPRSCPFTAGNWSSYHGNEVSETN